MYRVKVFLDEDYHDWVWLVDPLTGRVEEYKDKKDADKASKMFRSAVPVSATTDLQPTV